MLILHVFLHGIPVDIVSDRGLQFTSQVWREFCRVLGASMSLSVSMYRPMDRLCRTTKIWGQLSSVSATKPTSWSEQLPQVKYTHNSLISSATSLSPLKPHWGIYHHYSLARGDRLRFYPSTLLQENMETDLGCPVEDVRTISASLTVTADCPKLPTRLVFGCHPRIFL